MTVIGVTGGSGAGKSTVLDRFYERGAEIIRADDVYHRLLASCEPMREELRARFPEAFCGDSVNRKILSGLVFGDAKALADLNRITHKYVLDEIGRELQTLDGAGVSVAVIEAIALFESGLDKACGVTLAVTAPEKTRIARAVERDGLSGEEARRRIAGQKPDSYYKGKCRAVIENDGTEDLLTAKIDIFWEEYVL